MNTSSKSAQKWLRQPGSPADSERARRPRKLDSGGLVALARLAPILACAGALSMPALALAEDEAPPAEESPEASPAEASPEASPAAEGSVENVPEGEGAEPLPEDPPEYVEEGDLAEVVVTGFRVSLGAALQRKQRATGQVDAIVAEDIADFPDLNLAESLQRVPGVAITRVNGTEGNQVTVRGLSGLYTRVRVNGMETRAGVGNNGARNFDFNLFASELFNSVVVHKTASADLDEGSLGAVIDLNTARAFNYDEGFTFVVGAQGAYNDLSNTVRPRLTGLAAYRDPGGVWGATASIAYTQARLDLSSTDTVRWQTGPFRSVNGVTCNDAMGMPVGDAGCAEVNGAQHPRIPRYGNNRSSGDRLGLTGGIQFRPTDQTEVRLDALYATYDTQTDLEWLEVLFRGNEPTMDILGYGIQSFPVRYGDTNNSLIAADVDNAWVRSERVRTISESNFHQLSLALDHRFSDSFRVNALLGTSRSKAHTPHDTTLAYDARDYDGFSYNFTNDKYPLLAYNGADVTDGSIYTLTETRDRVQKTDSSFDTAEFEAHWELLDQLKFAAGVNYKQAALDLRLWNRDGTVCGLDLYDCDTNDDMMDDLRGIPGTADLSYVVDYQGQVGAGSNKRWAAPSIDSWVNAIGYYDVPLNVDEDSTYKVTEKNLGYFLQARGEILLGSEGGMRLLYDGGLRYVETRQSSSGYNSGTFITIDRPTYSDWLPSANTALWLADELVLRFAAARVMARPALANLSPGGNVDSFNYAVNFQNPNLDPTRATALDAASEWYFADGSMLSVALFWKDIDSFPIRESRRGTYASTGLPRSLIQPTSPADLSGPGAEGTCMQAEGCWDISELTNGPGSTLKGLELGFQAPFSAFFGALPPIIRSLGVVANYTYVDSTADYDFNGTTVTERLTGLSNGQYNATLYYDDSKFNARVSLAYRSDWLLNGPNQTGNLWEYAEANTRVDASSSYNVTENLKISLEALNLTNSPFSTKVDVDAERRVLYNKSGRTYLLGARLSL